ncbi:hypothetical protein AN964_22855 [Heyndrickxia shackletonii]|uniref:Uncharacterized protein n=1 Tax=Heyndrickxia shackletonii TaxID=157838 RepID=A0A0Q3WRF6_9BACI|nr:hypothetical protein [Heyndrickxia shackletonii]KQL50500.1 hypothetical protein AN964_22855 [Heyndrickxia shackletonii]NEY98197.1 hypothetical protein [Heyndrickxia shackletonii]
MNEHLEIEPIKRQQDPSYPYNGRFTGTLFKQHNGTVSPISVFIDIWTGRISGFIGGRRTTGFVHYNGYTEFTLAGVYSGIHFLPPEEYRGRFIVKRPIPPWQANGSWSSPFQSGQWSLSLEEFIH